jgi:hypothetical protein
MTSLRELAKRGATHHQIQMQTEKRKKAKHGGTKSEKA